MYNRPQRKSPRLKGFDYSSNGAYFITIKTYHGEHLFGEVSDGAMHLNALGETVLEEWLKSEGIRKEIFLDEFVIMPNHLHAIVLISKSEPPDQTKAEADSNVDFTAPEQTHGRASLRSTPLLFRPKRSLGSLVAGLKSSVTTKINRLRQTPGADVWQERYHDQIIRNDRHLENIRQYIAHNPANWATDSEGPCGPRQRRYSEEQV
ncbi:MAG: transposase [Meiothermus sp.]|nr:transposase [Meiothermus sp.]